MAVTAKVTASPGAGIASAPGRLATGGRYTSTDRIDSVSGAATVGVFGGFRSTSEDAGTGQGGFGQASSQQVPNPGQFSSLISRSAAAFSASDATTETRVAAPLFLTDMLHGVGVYEFNMRVFAGTLRQQGQVLNRYS